jgi:nitrous oxidase accessory protein NosD
VAGFLDGAYLERADGSQVVGVTLSESVRYGLHVMFTAGVVLRDNRVVWTAGSARPSCTGATRSSRTT